MDTVQYLGRAVARLKARGLRDVWRYSVHVIKEQAMASAIDLRFGGKLCRNNLDETIYRNGRHTMVHSGYHVLRDIFARVPIRETDVLVDVGCGEGRVINYWLSQHATNLIIGIEAVDAVAAGASGRYRKYENVSIIAGDVLDNLPKHGTLFYLYNPFSDETVERFEEATRPLNARIVYCQNNYMKPFESEHWQIEPIISKGTAYEFQAALITARAA